MLFHSALPGTATCILGPSGSGKTTLLRVLSARRKAGLVAGSNITLDQAPMTGSMYVSPPLRCDSLLYRTVVLQGARVDTTITVETPSGNETKAIQTYSSAV